MATSSERGAIEGGGGAGSGRDEDTFDAAAATPASSAWAIGLRSPGRSPAGCLESRAVSFDSREEPRSPRNTSTFATSVADHLMGLEGDSDAASETESFARPPTAREANRELYRRNERSVAARVIERYKCFLVCCAVVGLLWLLLAIAFYLYGWYVWYARSSRPCDQPLRLWLLLQLVATTVARITNLGPAAPSRGRYVTWILQTFPLITLSLGIVWLARSSTCATTNPELYDFVWWYIIFLGVTYVTQITATVILVSLLIYGAVRGWLAPPAGASPDAIKRIEAVQYDAELFADPEDPSDSRPPNECCCCCEEYCEQAVIKRTPCEHYFHEDCLAKWLVMQRTCPLCRRDLDVLEGEKV